MPDLQDGESVEIKGSAAKPYIIKNVGGVYSCSCPAWRNQSLRHRTADLQASAAVPRRTGRATAPWPGHASAVPSGVNQTEAGRAGALAGRNLDAGCRRERLVAERKT